MAQFSDADIRTDTRTHRDILHIDMNAFYCSCHAAAEPHKYQNRPTAVAGSPETRHGVVVTASYEARAQGVRTTMTTVQALAKCPHLILIRPDFTLYRKYSVAVFEIVRQYTPQVEVFSIDECFADVSGSHQFGTAREIAERIQERIWEELHLPCSIGVAPNKFLAKMASDMKKPRGITELWEQDIETKLWPLDIGDMFGIGGKTAERLRIIGIRTIGDVAQTNPERLLKLMGKRGPEIVQRAKGIDVSPVSAERDPIKSVGHSITLAKDADSVTEMENVLLNLSDQVGRRLRRHERMGRTVTLTIRFANRKTITRAQSRKTPTQLTEDIFGIACELLRSNCPTGSRVRLLGVTVSALSSPDAQEPAGEQLSLFDSSEPEAKGDTRDDHLRDKRKKLTKVTDALRDKYGEDIIVKGRMLEAHESNQLRNHSARGTSLQKDNLS